MRLIDSYIELIAYVAFLLKTVASRQPDFDRVKADINQLIAGSQEKQGQFSQGDFDLAQFAIFAWIDEAILSSAWNEKKRWQGEQLQRLYYQTADGGEIFFDKLNNLSPQQTEVREIYYLCLAMGFSGRFCNPGDEILLEQLKASNLKLVGGGTSLAGLEQVELFNGAYPELTDGQGEPGHSKKRFPIEILAGISLPVVFFGVLFLVYRFILAGIGQSFMKIFS